MTPLDPHDPPLWVDRAAYPFESRWMELPGGFRMHYVDEGEGEPLLFVHGTPTWSFEWRALVKALAPSVRCLAPDHLGFGLSGRPRQAPYSPEWHAGNLREFVRRLGLDRLTLVVHDYGGPIALPLAVDDPARIRRLVVLNSFGWPLDGDPKVVRASRLLGGRFGRFLYERLNLSLRVLLPSGFADRTKLTKALHRQYLAPFEDPTARGAVLWPLARALTSSTAHYRGIEAGLGRLRDLPVQLIWGMKDPAFGPDVLARWKEAFPRADVVELPVGHWPQEEAPEAVIAALRRFLLVTPA